MDVAAEKRPELQAAHHVSITVTDVEASVGWYERVLGMRPLPMTFPHYGSETTGYAVLMVEPSTGFIVGLHHHEANAGGTASETTTGLDHFALSVPQREDLNRWATWLSDVGVAHRGVNDVTEPIT